MAIYKNVESLEIVSYQGKKSEDFDKGVLFILEKLDALPVEDVKKVKHGHWNIDSTCSECGVHVLSNYMSYCPNCGAKMNTEMM